MDNFILDSLLGQELASDFMEKLDRKFKPKKEDAIELAGLMAEIASDLQTGHISPYVNVVAMEVWSDFCKWKNRVLKKYEVAQAVAVADAVSVSDINYSGIEAEIESLRDVRASFSKSRKYGFVTGMADRTIGDLQALKNIYEVYQLVELLEDENYQNELLSDFKKSKIEFYAESFEKRAVQLVECSTFLQFGKYGDTGEIHLHHANFCRARLCPMCSWRRSLKLFYQLSKIINAIDREQYEFLFVTLTVKNVRALNLRSQIQCMSKAFDKMSRRATYDTTQGKQGKRNKFHAICKGYYKALEVTFNPKTNTYHPHYHVLIAVPKNYFQGEDYLKTEELSEIWGRFLGVDYNPIVDIRKPKVYSSGGDVEIDSSTVTKKALLEIAKYTVKVTDLIDDKKQSKDEHLARIFTFETVLRGVRMNSKGGIFKELHEKLNLSATDDIETNDLDLNPTVADIILNCHWHGSGWNIVQEIPKNEEES